MTYFVKFLTSDNKKDYFAPFYLKSLEKLLATKKNWWPNRNLVKKVRDQTNNLA